MNSPESSKGFFESKESVEKERYSLTAEPRLVTIDGIDGLGKSTIAKKLVKKLQESFGEDKVIFVNSTKLSGSPKRERIGMRAKQENITASRLETYYIAGVKSAYEEVIIPALLKGKIVVADRSEVDLLRYSFWRNDKESVEKRHEYIRNGTVTHGLWAGNRIFLESGANDTLANLKSRKNNSPDDPTSLEEVKANIDAQKEAEKSIELMPHQGEIKIIREKVERVEDEEEREEYLNKIAERLSANLDLSEKK
ncbi:MAG: hypothetical protein KGJ58_04250 [Patescibacteria group bacterium]|nr:hypothetical protein [Patescibacteria group bacterium]MDE1988202.1 hypothetical protein [Patescibacteria group bacterium]MDE2218630.1 hypothetical protein [Patescibacteria group bacterium]